MFSIPKSNYLVDSQIDFSRFPNRVISSIPKLTFLDSQIELSCRFPNRIFSIPKSSYLVDSQIDIFDSQIEFIISISKSQFINSLIIIPCQFTHCVKPQYYTLLASISVFFFNNDTLSNFFCCPCIPYVFQPKSSRTAQNPSPY